MARSFADDALGPWLSGPSAANLPSVRDQFDRNRDPLRARHLDAMQKSESERREESAGRGSLSDPPKPVLKPQSAKGPNRDAWLLAERDRALARSLTNGVDAPHSKAAPTQATLPTNRPNQGPSR